MISGEIVRLLARRVPNYHCVAASFAKATDSLCTCAACKHRKQGGGNLYCGRVYERLADYAAEGHAIVNRFATCDAAQFAPEDYTNFQLEAERVESKPPPEAQADIMEGGANVNP